VYSVFTCANGLSFVCRFVRNTSTSLKLMKKNTAGFIKWATLFLRVSEVDGEAEKE